MKNKLYHTVLARDSKASPWHIECGFYELEDAQDEADTARDQYGRGNVRLMTTGHAQEAVMAKLQTINGAPRVVAGPSSIDEGWFDGQLAKAKALAPKERREALAAFTLSLEHSDKLSWCFDDIHRGDYCEASQVEALRILNGAPPYGRNGYRPARFYSEIVNLIGLLCYKTPDALKAWDKLSKERRRDLCDELDLVLSICKRRGIVKRDDKKAPGYAMGLVNHRAGFAAVKVTYSDGHERTEDYVRYNGLWHNVHLLNGFIAGVRWSEIEGFNPWQWAKATTEKNTGVKS